MNHPMSNEASYLFATPSWAEGVARLVDFGDTLTQYNTDLTVGEADARALGRDWHAVGREIWTALGRVSR